MSPDGIMYPHAELRDPYDCYHPGYYGPDQDPKELALIRLVPNAVIKSMYPQARIMVDESSQFPSVIINLNIMMASKEVGIII